MTLTLLVIAAVVAVGDWAAVQARLFRIEYLLKPLTLGLLVAAAASASIGEPKPWIVAALVLGLLGDIGLMLSKGDTDLPFLAGLGAFLLGHVAYIVGFLQLDIRTVDLVAGLFVVAGVAGLVLPAILLGAIEKSGNAFAAIVMVYVLGLATMTVLATGTGIVATAVGGVLFLASDAILARGRFVAPVPRGPLLVIVAYHLAQFLILIGLIRSF